MKPSPWPAMMLVALAACCLAWLPRCEAATKALAKEKLLLRRSRMQRTEPFIVSFRVTIADGDDNVELANNLSARINTPHSPMAGVMRYSVARVFNGTFPPVQWAPSTTVGAFVPATTPPPAAPALYNPVVLATTPAPTAMETALQALRLAKENQFTYDKLTRKMTRATRAHANALVFGNPEGTTPLPTLAPFSAAASKAKETEPQLAHTMGRLIYDAFVNTPKPIEITTPMPTPASPNLAVVSGTMAIPNLR